MNVKITNQKIAVEEIEVDDLSQSSLVLIGDADVITCSTVFDTPSDSVVYSPTIPLVPPQQEISPRARVHAQIIQATKKAIPR